MPVKMPLEEQIQNLKRRVHDLELEVRAYQLLANELHGELRESYRRCDANSAEEVDTTNILLREILRLSNYSNLLNVAQHIDQKVYGGKRNYVDLVECDFSHYEPAEA